MLDVTKWPIFSLLDTDDLVKIAKICVFGSSGNEAIYVTETDDVYAIGSNCSGCLGLGMGSIIFLRHKLLFILNYECNGVHF